MTIGQTRISTVKLIDKAVRRAGIPPSSVTAEDLATAKDSLAMLLSSMVTEGLNLWCIDTQYITLTAEQAAYELPAGTEELLDVLYSVPTLATEGTVRWVAPIFSTAPTPNQIDIEGSDDGVVYTSRAVIAETVVLNEKRWYRIDPAISATDSFRVVGADSAEFASEIRDTVVTPIPRGAYQALPNKTSTSTRPTSYWFEKLVDPRITLWPVPNSSTAFLTVVRHHLVEDITTFSGELAIPTRWYDPVVWELALRLAFEIPGSTAERRAELSQMAQAMHGKVENGETDSGPITYAPNIGVYTR